MIPSIILFFLSIPLILSLIPPQKWIGVRTSKTLSDEAYWYRVNRFAGWALLISSGFYIGIAATFPCTLPCGINFSQWLVQLGAFALPLLLSLLFIKRYIASL
jgi:uncharacterized membrane protein